MAAAGSGAMGERPVGVPGDGDLGSAVATSVSVAMQSFGMQSLGMQSVAMQGVAGQSEMDEGFTAMGGGLEL